MTSFDIAPKAFTSVVPESGSSAEFSANARIWSSADGRAVEAIVLRNPLVLTRFSIDNAVARELGV